MKKIVLLFLFLSSTITFSQSRGIRIGFIDMEYILENVPEYLESTGDATMIFPDQSNQYFGGIQL